MMKRKLFFTSVLTLFCMMRVCAQTELNIPVLIPSGNYYPYILKPGFGGLLIYHIGDNHYKIGAGLGYYIFHPTQDTFNTYDIGEQGNLTGLQLLPKKDVISKYNILEILITNDYVILDTAKLTPIVELNLFMHVFSITESDQDGNYYNWGIEPCVALRYKFNINWYVKIGLARSMGFGGSIGRQAFWQPSISIIHQSF